MAAPSALRMDHVVLPVHDAGAARAFYGDVLGLPLVAAFSGDGWGGRSWLMMAFGLGDGGRHLVTTAFAGIDRPLTSPFPRDARHLAFAVDSEVERVRWRERLVEAGAEHWEEDHGSQRSLYFVDPSGNVLEITTPATPPFATDRDEAPTAVVESWLAAVGRR
jgi:catechol 2,3-dioxygenase-like lactoylglutathione lyase family enzyme